MTAFGGYTEPEPAGLPREIRAEFYPAGPGQSATQFVAVLREDTMTEGRWQDVLDALASIPGAATVAFTEAGRCVRSRTPDVPYAPSLPIDDA